MVWRGNYDTSSAYHPNDVVRVIPDVKYYNEAGMEIPIGNTSTDIGGLIPISLGLFVCTQYVPPAWANDIYFTDKIAPQFLNPDTGDYSIPYHIRKGIRWYSHNVYYPIYPEIPSSYTGSIEAVIDGKDYNFKIDYNQTYWQAMPVGMSSMNVCRNGISETWYIMGHQSGSLFQAGYVPYIGG